MNPAPAPALSQASRLAEMNHWGDPLADEAVEDLAALPAAQRDGLLNRFLENGLVGVKEAPESWCRLADQAEYVPYWVDWKTMNVGSRAFLRAGGLGMVCLTCYVTPLFYCLSNGNKALTFSGNLTRRAARRGRETARFVIETCLPNNLRRHGDGFKVTLRVRLMHAQVRRMIALSGRWDYEQHGMPISQVYMAAMMSLLSAQWIEGLRMLGVRLTPDEEEGMMQLWRYSAYLIGVHPELIFSTRQEANRFWNLVLEQEPAPDDDARGLVHAILQTIPEVMGLEGKTRAHMAAFSEGVAVAMLGPRLARDLQLPQTWWRHAPKLMRGLVPLWELAERLVPATKKFAQFHGTQLWLRMAEFPPQGGLEMFAPGHSHGTEFIRRPPRG